MREKSKMTRCEGMINWGVPRWGLDWRAAGGRLSELPRSFTWCQGTAGVSGVSEPSSRRGGGRRAELDSLVSYAVSGLSCLWCFWWEQDK